MILDATSIFQQMQKVNVSDSMTAAYLLERAAATGSEEDVLAIAKLKEKVNAGRRTETLAETRYDGDNLTMNVADMDSECATLPYKLQVGGYTMLAENVGKGCDVEVCFAKDAEYQWSKWEAWVADYDKAGITEEARDKKRSEYGGTFSDFAVKGDMWNSIVDGEDIEGQYAAVMLLDPSDKSEIARFFLAKNGGSVKFVMSNAWPLNRVRVAKNPKNECALNMLDMDMLRKLNKFLLAQHRANNGSLDDVSRNALKAYSERLAIASTLPLTPNKESVVLDRKAFLTVFKEAEIEEELVNSLEGVEPQEKLLAMYTSAFALTTLFKRVYTSKQKPEQKAKWYELIRKKVDLILGYLDNPDHFPAEDVKILNERGLGRQARAVQLDVYSNLKWLQSAMTRKDSEKFSWSPVPPAEGLISMVNENRAEYKDYLFKGDDWDVADPTTIASHCINKGLVVQLYDKQTLTDVSSLSPPEIVVDAATGKERLEINMTPELEKLKKEGRLGVDCVGLLAIHRHDLKAGPQIFAPPKFLSKNKTLFNNLSGVLPMVTSTFSSKGREYHLVNDGLKKQLREMDDIKRKHSRAITLTTVKGDGSKKPGSAAYESVGGGYSVERLATEVSDSDKPKTTRPRDKFFSSVEGKASGASI